MSDPVETATPRKLHFHVLRHDPRDPASEPHLENFELEEAAGMTLFIALNEIREQLDLRDAEADQLQLLPRVGPALAGRIIEYREANGPFRTIDEIVAVKGIGDSSFKKLEPYLVTSGATTVTEKIRLPRSKKTGDATGN